MISAKISSVCTRRAYKVFTHELIYKIATEENNLRTGLFRSGAAKHTGDKSL
jgi:hypothetical protein